MSDVNSFELFLVGVKGWGWFGEDVVFRTNLNMTHPNLNNQPQIIRISFNKIEIAESSDEYGWVVAPAGWVGCFADVEAVGDVAGGWVAES